jgi:hypothetical protein
MPSRVTRSRVRIYHHLGSNSDFLFKKEKLLVPFNQKSEAINLGNQFNEQKWTKDFTHYCNTNLNYRIAPVDQANKKGSKGPKIIVWGLKFNSAWAITMPAPDPKP